MANGVTRVLTGDEREKLLDMAGRGYIGFDDYKKFTTPGERIGYLVAEQRAGQFLEKAAMFRTVAIRNRVPAGVGPNGVADRYEEMAMFLLDCVGTKKGSK